MDDMVMISSGLLENGEALQLFTVNTSKNHY